VTGEFKDVNYFFSVPAKPTDAISSLVMVKRQISYTRTPNHQSCWPIWSNDDPLSAMAPILILQWAVCKCKRAIQKRLTWYAKFNALTISRQSMHTWMLVQLLLYKIALQSRDS